MTQGVSLPVWITVGFTGHRSLPDPKAAEAGIRSVLDELASQYPNLAGVSSAARGADTLFLEALRNRGIPRFLILPFSAEQFRNDFSESDWRRVQPLLRDALEVEIVSPQESPDDAYLEAGIRTVDRADIVIAVWDGQPARGKGGTGEVVEYARALGKPIRIIHPSTGEISEEGLAPKAPPSGKCPDAKEGGSAFLPAVLEQFEALDAQAKHNAPKARLLLLRVILLHLAATAIAIVSIGLHLSGTPAYAALGAKLSALVWALYLAGIHHRAQHKWLDSRIACEWCRSYLSLWCISRSPLAEPRTHAPAQLRLRTSLRMAWLLDAGAALELEDARETYLRNRVHDQISYYRAGHRSAKRASTWLQRGATAGTALAIILAGAAMLWSYLGGKSLGYDLVKLGSLLMPLLSATLLSLVVGMDFGRRAVRYDEIAGILNSYAGKIEACRNWSGLWRSVSEVETLLLQEVAEWHAVAKFAGGSH